MGSLKKDPSFVFCNFNKFLKNNPTTVRSWIRILREVPGSILCSLENPTEGISYLRKFIHEATAKTVYHKHNDTTTYVPLDGDDINNRIFFLPWEGNPFDHQRRSFDFCNIVLDSYPYNGHTVAQDALYAGVPIVTRSDGVDMSSRVSTSANRIIYDDDDSYDGSAYDGTKKRLSDELNAYNGPTHYEDLAISIGNNQTKFNILRTKLISTCLQKNPMHRYWDVSRYVRNFQTALFKVWDKFLSGESPDHIFVQEKEKEEEGNVSNSNDIEEEGLKEEK